MKQYLRALQLVVTLLFTLPCTAIGQVSVEAKLDTADILIGEQVQLEVKCAVNAKQKVNFPFFQPQQELTPGVEVIYNGRIDTVWSNNKQRIELSRKYTITAFDSALYAIPPFKISIDGKEYASRGNIGLKVSTVAVDTVHIDKFSGPHGAVDMPFEWSWRITLWALLGMFTAFITLALCTRLSDPRLITRKVVINPPIPAHVTAIDDIQRIKSQTEADPKVYYTQLTETLRTYIEKRFGFNAKEMTTSEIIDELCATDNLDSLNELKDILMKADLVKFAKLSTSLPEQDRSLVQALNFVQTTKIEPQEQPKPRIEYVTLSGNKQHHLRLMMSLAAATTTALTLGIMAYVIYDLYCCFA